jgi:ubiquinone/menaquinone biosynthesis C-methylase UbiE
MSNLKMNYFDLIDKERNIYELAELYSQNRRNVNSYIDLLQDPFSKEPLKLENDKLIGKTTYEVNENVPNFTSTNLNSTEWQRLNKQFLNYHKSLSVYTAINSAPIINYLAIETEFGFLKDVKVLDIGGGTGHTHCSFFHYPETIEYFLLDPNLRLLHDQFLRLYPKLTYLEMAHILANAENLPIKDNSFDIVINLSAVDHFNDHKEFISEVYRVLKPGGKFLISSHLDVDPSKDEKPTKASKIFSKTFWERISRYLYYKRHAVGDDDHTLSLEDEKPIEKALLNSGFKITKQEVFKRHFYFIAEKEI